MNLSKISKKLLGRFYRNYSTKNLSAYWLNPVKNEQYWIDYQKTWNNPRRYAISYLLSKISFVCLLEIGCGSGPNLINILKYFEGPNKKNNIIQLSGCDINPIAIEIAKKSFHGGIFYCCSGDNVFMSDKGIDVVLTDMCLIYVGPFKIGRYLKEIKRIGRNWVILVEYHHENWLKRLKMRLFSGRHSYNYRKLLQKYGFYDIIIYKMPKFEEDNDDEFRHIIVAKIPKEYYV